MSIVKINVLTVPEEQREVLEQRFGARAGAVENSDGFEWFELLRPLEGTDQYLVYTRWRDEESFQAWMEGGMRASHGQASGSQASGPESGEAPKDGEAGGEKRKPAATGSTLWSFEVVQQAAPKNA
ncbi:antibiotic biosynthesis monooxygenase [Streptomyces sp. HNM0574]|uniref:antibiotic biosynthesis monooxygenase family protein n=1 Tax=Streptomyces sp. HNM0574 TaxID=2714954 RepID=UPI00146E6E97|nr:antibiotic biosynthesis monooxygenase [Streptomyces sp. HNM0574]NLU70106.1 antibiotic biosynthesis monooxygenase [Streptomyces sp. HNM0574]